MSDDQRRLHDGERNMPVGEFAEAIDMHPLWQGAMLVTPIEGRAWHPGDRDDFLALCAMVCDVLYPQSVLAERRAFGRPMAGSQIDWRAEELADEVTAELGVQLALAEERAAAAEAAIRELQEANARLEGEIVELRKAAPRCGRRWTSRSGSGGKGPEVEFECELPAGHAGAHGCVSPGAPAPVEPPPDGTEGESVTMVDASRMSAESQELLRAAAAVAGEPDAAAAGVTIVGREGFVVDARPCKVDDCDNLAVKRGQWAGICEDDREHLEGGGAVLVDGVPMVLNGRSGRGLVRQE